MTQPSNKPLHGLEKKNPMYLNYYELVGISNILEYALSMGLPTEDKRLAGKVSGIASAIADNKYTTKGPKDAFIAS